MPPDVPLESGEEVVLNVLCIGDVHSHDAPGHLLAEPIVESGDETDLSVSSGPDIPAASCSPSSKTAACKHTASVQKGFLSELRSFVPPSSQISLVPTCPNFTKDTLLERVHEFFKASSQCTVCTLVYQGPAEAHSGSWCFEGQLTLTFAELHTLWLNRWRSHSSQRLVLLLDAPGSCQWVQDLKRMPDQQQLGMCIQACTADAPDGHEPGAFLEAFMRYSRLGEALPGNLRPCFHSTWAPKTLAESGSRLTFLRDSRNSATDANQTISQAAEDPTSGTADNKACTASTHGAGGPDPANPAGPAQHQYFHEDLYAILEMERMDQSRQSQPPEGAGQLPLPCFLHDEENGSSGAASAGDDALSKTDKGSEPSDLDVQLTPRQIARASNSRLSRMTSWVDQELLGTLSGIRLGAGNSVSAEFDGLSPRPTMMPRSSAAMEGSRVLHAPSSTFSDFGDVPSNNLQRPRRFEVAGEDSSGYLFKDDAERYAQLRALRQEDRFASYYDSDPGSEELSSLQVSAGVETQ